MKYKQLLDGVFIRLYVIVLRYLYHFSDRILLNPGSLPSGQVKLSDGNGSLGVQPWFRLDKRIERSAVGSIREQFHG